MLFSLSCQCSLSASEQTVKIGIVRYSEPAINSPIVKPTIEAINKKLEGKYQVKVLSLDREALEEAAKNGDVDIFLSSAGFYRRLVRFGARDLATAISARYLDPNHSEGAAIIVLNSRKDLGAIPDLKGKQLLVGSANAFSGYQIPMGEIAARGHSPSSFFKNVEEIPKGTNFEFALKSLKNGKSDVIFLRQCALEEYLKKHPEDSTIFRVVEPKNSGSECLRSTDLYPTWTLASTKSATPSVSRFITSAVLDMPETKDGFVWGVSTDFSQVDELLKTLQIGPYEYLKEKTVKQFFYAYWPFIMLGVFFIIALFLHARRAEYLIRKRTAQLRRSTNERIETMKKAEKAAQRLEMMQKIGVVNQLSAIFAHEMRQPLGAMSLYLEALKTMIQEGETSKERINEVLELFQEQNMRAETIVQKVLAYRKNTPKRDRKVDLSKAVRLAMESLLIADPAISRIISKDLKNESWIKGDSLELELVAVNLIKNAVEAVQDKRDAFVRVQVTTSENKVQLVIADNGNIKSTNELKSIQGTLESTKESGLGIGLLIVKGLVERHGGRVDFFINNPSGLKVVVSFPRP